MIKIKNYKNLFKKFCITINLIDIYVFVKITSNKNMFLKSNFYIKYMLKRFYYK